MEVSQSSVGVSIDYDNAWSYEKHLEEEGVDQHHHSDDKNKIYIDTPPARSTTT